MITSFTKVASSLRGRAFSNRMVFVTIGALSFMLLGSMILVSTNNASWGSIQNNILFILVIIDSLRIVFFHANHLISHFKHQLGLLFQKPLECWILITIVDYELSCQLVQLVLSGYELFHVDSLVGVGVINLGVFWSSHLFGLKGG